MPTYEFTCPASQCPSGGARFDVRLPMDDRDRACVSCPVCGTEARRCVVPSKAPAAVMMKSLETGGQVPDRLLP